MSDLPQMLHGPIAADHSELMHSIQLAEHHHHEKSHGEGCTHERDCPVIVTDSTCDQDTCSQTCPADCTENGGTCLENSCLDKKRAFQPSVAGWSSPPELHAR